MRLFLKRTKIMVLLVTTSFIMIGCSYTTEENCLHIYCEKNGKTYDHCSRNGKSWYEDSKGKKYYKESDLCN